MTTQKRSFVDEARRANGDFGSSRLAFAGAAQNSAVNITAGLLRIKLVRKLSLHATASSLRTSNHHSGDSEDAVSREAVVWYLVELCRRCRGPCRLQLPDYAVQSRTFHPRVLRSAPREISKPGHYNRRHSFHPQAIHTFRPNRIKVSLRNVSAMNMVARSLVHCECVKSFNAVGTET